MQSKPRVFLSALVSGSLCLSSSFAAAATRPGVAIPTAGTTLMTCEATSVAVSAAAVAQATQQGCVLPVVDAPVAQIAPPPPPVMAAPAEGGGIGILPILLGVAALAGLLLLLKGGGDDDGEGSISFG